MITAVQNLSIVRLIKRLSLIILPWVIAYIGYLALYRYTFEGDHLITGLIVFWVFTAYIIAPRVHRRLTKLYLPNYYIGRARTGDGLLGDPVNLAFIGNREQIIAAMNKAGWVQADDLNVTSSIAMIKNSVLRKSYPTAPVSSLYLFNKKQDLVFQQEVDGTTSKRHHIRFWECPQDWYLPGGAQANWLAAATFDRSVGLSLFTFQITHKIASAIDEERDYVVSTLRDTKGVKITIAKNFTNAYHDRNGGGDYIQTDGTLPFITLGPT